MLTQILIQNDCFITHTFYPGNSHYGTLYERIDYTITNNTSHQVSACTIKSGDIAPTNYYQDIGIIIKSANVDFSCTTGAATYLEKGVLFTDPEKGGHVNPDATQIVEAIVHRSGCNEFRLSNYEVIGFFLAEPPYVPGNKILPDRDTLSNFHDKTVGHGLRYYKLIGGDLYDATFNGSEFIAGTKVNVCDLYR